MKKLILFLIVFCFIATNCFSENLFTVTAEPYPPYVGPKLKNNGWTWVVAKTALERVGYKAKLKYLPWARALMTTKAGKIDGLFPAFFTVERTKTYLYSVPIAEARTGFFKLKKRTDIVFNGNLRTMTKYRIGVGRGYATSPEFDNATYLKKRLQIKSIQSLKMLWKGRLDLATGSELVDGYNLKQLEPKYPGISKKIMFVEPPLTIQYCHMAVSKNAPNAAQKLEDFNIGMRMIMLDGTYMKIFKKYNK